MDHMPVCHVFGAGEFSGPVPVVDSRDIVIAADGGFTILKQLGLVADYIIGDFDSLPEIPPHKNIVRLPEQKDITDMRAALALGLEKGFREFSIYGGTGGRFEHTLANLQCIAWLSQNDARGYLRDERKTVTAITNGSIFFGRETRGYISIFAHTDIAKGVFLVGLKYPLTDATVTNIFPIGVSNEFTGIDSSVTVHDGTIIVVYPPGIKPL